MKFGALLLQDPIVVIEVIAAALTFVFIVKLSLEQKPAEEVSRQSPQASLRSLQASGGTTSSSIPARATASRSWTPPALRLQSENEIDLAQSAECSSTQYFMVGSTISFKPQALCGQHAANACF